MSNLIRYKLLIIILALSFITPLIALEENRVEYGILMYENGEYQGGFTFNTVSTSDDLEGEWIIVDEYYGEVYFDAPQFDQLVLYSTAAYELQEDGTYELWGRWINPDFPYPNVYNGSNFWPYRDYLGM